MSRNAKNTRMCVGCMSRKNKTELVCIYKKDGEFCIDKNPQKTSGRSAYLCPDKKCMEKAIKKKCFPRVLKCEIPSGFYDSMTEFFNKIYQE